MRSNSTVKLERVQTFQGDFLRVFFNGEHIGRVVPLKVGFHARHDCRVTGGIFSSEQDAVDYLIGLDLKIDAEFISA